MTTRTLAISLVTAGLLIAGCGDGDGTTAATTTRAEASTSETSEATTTTTATPVDPTFLQLCGVLNAAVGGEIDVAKSTFDDGPLHTLAAQTIDVDRGAAARLLEAKEAVESDLAAATPDGTALIADLEALTTATADALVVTGTPVLPTCDEETP